MVSRENAVTHLRNVSIAVPEYEKQVDFYENKWRLKKTESEPGVSYFAAEGSLEQYIVRVRKSDVSRIDLLSFGMRDPESVDALAQSLAENGVRFASEPGPLRPLGVATASAFSIEMAEYSSSRRMSRSATSAS
jgi:Glyoxalase/Bleomycin resistance protein/Dioxygenase superfamily